MKSPIPFNKPSLTGNEINYVVESIKSGHIAGDGIYTAKCHELLQDRLGISKALLTTSCTDALEMCSILLDIQPGDEVIAPSYTFVTTINSFVLRGAKPVFADIKPETLNLDETKIESLITPRTKAIIPVHYAGVGCEMDAILQIAGDHHLAVVEDNAHGLFGRYKGRYLGTFGCLATQSFHETKNFSCGEGGALLINDPQYVERAEIIREKGTNRSRFFRGQVDKYGWVDIGSSYLPSDLLAAFLYAQLESANQIQAKRKQIWEFYQTNLSGWAAAHDVSLPYISEYCEQTYHMFYLLMPSLEIRQKFISFLKSNEIMSVFHYLPLHKSEKGLELGGGQYACPITDKISDTLVRLPFYNDLSDQDLSRIVETICRFEF